MSEISRYDPRPAYMHDPVFRQMVDAIHAVLREHRMTPGEVRSAAVYACARHEMESSPQPLFISVRPTETGGEDG